MHITLLFFFFFSSRRRHTRFDCDWSSDVCSSDLVPLAIIDHAPQLPKVPTLAEAGFPGLEIYSSFSVVAPAGTPPAIVQRMSVEIARAMKSPGLAGKLEHHTLIPVFDTPEQSAAHLKKEKAAWAAVIRRNA